MKLTDKTDAELKLIALQKKRNGCATSEALRAQSILWSRMHPCGYGNGYKPKYIATGRNFSN